MMGFQCPKRLWLYRKRPELRPDISDSQQMVFERGTDTGLLARQLFPQGKDASPIDHFKFPESIQQTAKWIADGEPVIYEAAFQFDKVMAALDILVRQNGKWFGYEVKSTTEVKDAHVSDAALQYYVITGAGLPLQDIFIVHLNKEFVRNGELDLANLFIVNSVKKQVLQMQDDIPVKIEELKALLKQRTEPAVDIGPHCSDPYACEFTDHCWKHIPDTSVFNLSRMKGEKKFELYYQGITEFHQLPAGFKLTKAQSLQVKTHLEDYVHIDPAPIRNWISQLMYPLYFMDFESFMPVVPLYNGSRPYQQIVFQFSVHSLKIPGADPGHQEYLGEPETDPRPEFIRQLLKALGTKGTILVYNKAFEVARLKELQRDFPAFKKPIGQLLSRIADLMEPFQQKWYYHPAMNGSYSIKQVLPALVPELSYKDFEIGEGGSAMAAFEGLVKIDDTEQKSKIRNHLLEYCKLDTWAMVKILEKLNEY